MRKYCVVVMDNWTPVRRFWFRKNAERYARQRPRNSYLYERKDDQWVERNFK